MVFLELVELVAVVFFVILGVTQIIIPLWNSNPLFPAFRIPGKIESDLGEAKEELHSLEVEQEVLRKRKEIKDLKSSLSLKNKKPQKGQ